MRRLALCLLCLCPALATGRAEQDVRVYLERANRPLHRFVLDNGMVCLVKEDHSAPVAAVQIWLGTGSIHEDEYLGAGLSHCMEHMIFKGTATRGPADITREINDAGGDINAYTSVDRTVFHVVIPARNWRVGVDVLGDAVMHASLPEDEWEREKAVILREMAMGRDDPMRVMWKLTGATAYRVHPYRLPVIGHEEVFNRMTRDDLAAFYARHYTPDNMIAVVVGDVNRDEVERFLRERFRDFERRPRPPVVIPPEPPQLAPRLARERGAYNLARARMVFHTVGLSHPDTPALDVLSYIVGHGRSSRLVQELKERRQLVYDIDAFSYTPKDPGLFAVSATFDPDREEEVVDAIRTELAAWRQGAFTQEELAKAKRQLLVQELAALQTVRGQADSYGSGEFYAGDPLYAERYLAGIDAVTPEQLAAVASRYLQPQGETLVILEPEREGSMATDAPADELLPGAVEKVELADGPPLLVREDHRLPFVHFCVALSGGLLAETEANSGITRLMAELLRRGTTTRSAEALAREIESLGASLEPFSGWNSFGLQGRCLTEDLDTLLALAADCLLHPTFPEEELEKQRQVQLAAIRQAREAPFFLAVESLKGLLFEDHPYRLDAAGSERSVGGLTRDEILAHHAALVRRGNAVVALFGDVTREQARTLAAQHLAGMPEGERTTLTEAEATPTLPAEVTRREPKEQAILLVGYPGVAVDDPRIDAVDLLREAMSGLSSELGIEVREKRGLVYYVGALQRAGLHPGLFSFYAGTREDAVPEVRALMQAQVDRLVERGLEEAELARAREQLIAAHEMSLQDNGGLAQTCALNELYGLGYGHAFQTEERLRALDREAVRQVASELLRPNRQAVAVLLPLSHEDGELNDEQ